MTMCGQTIPPAGLFAAGEDLALLTFSSVPIGLPLSELKKLKHIHIYPNEASLPFSHILIGSFLFEQYSNCLSQFTLLQYLIALIYHFHLDL